MFFLCCGFACDRVDVAPCFTVHDVIWVSTVVGVRKDSFVKFPMLETIYLKKQLMHVSLLIQIKAQSTIAIASLLTTVGCSFCSSRYRFLWGGRAAIPVMVPVYTFA